MKKLLCFLSILLFLPFFASAHFDNFDTTYDSYYKVIDSCEATSTGWISLAGASANPGNDVSDPKDGAGTIMWSKSNTDANTYVARQGAYNCDLGTLTNAGYLQFWYKLPSLVGGSSQKWTKVDCLLTSVSIVTNAGTNKITATTPTTDLPVGWNLFKRQLTVGASTSGSTISTFAINITTDMINTTAGGIMLDDIRVVSDKNTTNGVWGETSGVWTIHDLGAGNKVYRQNGTSNLSIPQLMTKAQYKNFVYSAKITPVSSGIKYSGLVFKQSSYDKSYFMFNYNDAGSTKYFELNKCNGTNVTIVTSTTAASASSYWLKVVCNGTAISCYASANGTVWGTPVLTETDVTSATGYVGLFSGADSGDVRAYFDDVKVLPIPSNLTAIAGDNQVQLVFLSNAYTGEVASYNIYRSLTANDPAPALLGTCTGTTYNDTTAVNGTKYYYKVTANVLLASPAFETTDIAMSNETVGEPHPGINITNNPFTPLSANPALNKATFAVYNSGNERVELYVYKPSGTLVAVVTPENSAFSWSASMSTFKWDGKTNSGTALEGGVYIWQIKVGGALAGKGTIVLAK